MPVFGRTRLVTAKFLAGWSNACILQKRGATKVPTEIAPAHKVMHTIITRIAPPGGLTGGRRPNLGGPACVVGTPPPISRFDLIWFDLIYSRLMTHIRIRACGAMVSGYLSPAPDDYISQPFSHPKIRFRYFASDSPTKIQRRTVSARPHPGVLPPGSRRAACPRCASPASSALPAPPAASPGARAGYPDPTAPCSQEAGYLDGVTGRPPLYPAGTVARRESPAWVTPRGRGPWRPAGPPSWRGQRPKITESRKRRKRGTPSHPGRRPVTRISNSRPSPGTPAGSRAEAPPGGA